jgi:hypothetical protein
MKKIKGRTFLVRMSEKMEEPKVEESLWITLTKDTVTEGIRPFEGKLMAFRTTRYVADKPYMVNGTYFGHFNWEPQWRCFNLTCFLMPTATHGNKAMNSDWLGNRTLEIREATPEEMATLRAAWETGKVEMDYCRKGCFEKANPWGWKIK